MKLFCIIIVIFLFSCELKNTVHGNCNSKLESALLDDLLSMIIKLKGTGNEKQSSGMQKRTDQIPSFSATLKGHQVLKSKAIVQFDKIWTNNLKGFDLNTGIFTAPLAGIYQFSCSLMGQKASTLRVELWKNNKATTAMFAGDTNYHTATMNMVLDLEKGDRVYMKNMKDTTYNIWGGYNIFSGFMISQ